MAPRLRSVAQPPEHRGAFCGVHGREHAFPACKRRVERPAPFEGVQVTVSAAIRDVSERKRMEADAKLLAQRLASAVESVQDAFALFGEDDRLVLCNSVYRRLILPA